MSEQMLPVQKEETIAKLYTLRAGLSVIAKNVDKARQERQALEDQDKKERDMFQKVTTLEESQSRLQRAVDSLPLRIENEKVSMKRNLFRFFLLLFATIGAIALATIGFITMEKRLDIPFIMNHLDFYLSFSVLSSIVLIILNIVLFKTDRHPLTDALPHDLRRYESMLAKNESELETINCELFELYQELSEARECTNQQAEKSIQQQAALQAENEAIYKSLVSAYTPMIVEADWKNIDLLIFYLETGRAESWKEALQLADRQQQTNQITRAIQQASAAISQTMRRSAQALGNLMAQSFSDLQSELRQINGKNFEMQNALLSQGEEALSEARLQNALLEKANKTSEELVAVLRYRNN